MVVICGCSSPAARPQTTTNPDPTTPRYDVDRPEGLPTGKVVWIADGDTIEVDTGDGVIDVRLLGINTPEIGECYGEEPLAYLIEYLKGETVGLEIADKDQFGRTLASVWLVDELINLTLVSEGYAIALTPGVSDPYGSMLLVAEELSFASGSGLWSPEACGGGEVADVRFDIDASQFNPPGPDDDALDDEYIVIVNDGSEAIQLKGWTLRDESSLNRLAFDGSVTLASGERLTIASGCSTDPGWCGTTPIWNNDGDMALLLDEAGRVVARARY